MLYRLSSNDLLTRGLHEEDDNKDIIRPLKARESKVSDKLNCLALSSSSESRLMAAANNGALLLGTSAASLCIGLNGVRRGWRLA